MLFRPSLASKRKICDNGVVAAEVVRLVVVVVTGEGLELVGGGNAVHTVEAQGLAAVDPRAMLRALP